MWVVLWKAKSNRDWYPIHDGSVRTKGAASLLIEKLQKRFPTYMFKVEFQKE